MVASSVTRESDFLQTLISGYEAEGFSVFSHPAREMLPPFMHGYRPDAIAVRGEKKIAIELKSNATIELDRKDRIQQIFLEHPEWELRVYYIPRRPSEEKIRALSLTEIDAALAEADQLRKAGHFRAALMMAFAGLEAAGRALLPESLARPQPANKLIEVLASEGIVTPAEAESLREVVSSRNTLVHGDFSLPITEQEVGQVIAAARMITGLLREPRSL